jgi:hypothetical protein
MSDLAPISLLPPNPKDSTSVASLVATLVADLNERSSITPAYVSKILRQRGCQVPLAVRGEQILGLVSFSFRPSL